MSETARNGLRVLGAVGLTLVTGVLSGCLSTFQARQAEPSGFLGDYSQLRPGRDGEALLVYISPQADFRAYNKIMLDPVRVYATQGSALAKLPREELQDLVNYLDATLREQLKTDYAIVTAPGPGVLRLRVAITEARGSRVILDTISSVMPYGIALSGLKKVVTGSATSVGSVGGEFEAVDSVSNQRLAAAVDKRIGRKYTGKFDRFNKWHAAQDAFDYWASRLKARLAAERNKGTR